METFFTYLNWVSVLVSLIAFIFSAYSIKKTRRELSEYKKRLKLKQEKYNNKVKEMKDEY